MKRKFSNNLIWRAIDFACAAREKLRKYKNRYRIQPQYGLFSYQKFPDGYRLIGCLNWVVSTRPDGRITASRRPWPWSRWGLPADKMKSIHFRKPNFLKHRI